MDLPESDEVSAIIAQFRSQLKNPDKPFSLLVRFQVKEGAQERVEASFTKASAETLKEDGVVAFHLNREATDATRYVVYERWKTLVALDWHLRTPYITRLRSDLNEWIVGAPEFHVLIPALPG